MRQVGRSVQCRQNRRGRTAATWPFWLYAMENTRRGSRPLLSEPTETFSPRGSESGSCGGSHVQWVALSSEEFCHDHGGCLLRHPHRPRRLRVGTPSAPLLVLYGDRDPERPRRLLFYRVAKHEHIRVSHQTKAGAAAQARV